MAAKASSTSKADSEVIAPLPMTIPPLEFGMLRMKIKGTAPYMQARFSAKAMQAMRTKMAQGSVAKKGKAREARDFDADYEAAKHISTDGWCGIPASALRAACISACRIVGFRMTLAKLSLFFEADGHDVVDGTPLIRIIGEPKKTEMATRNATGVVDIRVRPMWLEWSAVLLVKFDKTQFTDQDVVNLISRAGGQVGIGEGRPDSKSSAGMGLGLFVVE